MSYGQPDAYADIAILQAFWNGQADPIGYYDVVGAAQRLIYQASFDPSIKLIVAGSNVFTDALSSELKNEGSWIDQNINASGSVFADNLRSQYGNTHPPRWWILDGIRQAIQPSFFSLGKGDPTGIAGWISTADSAGAALASTIAGDPDPDVRLAALQLVKSSALPISWVRPLLGALDALQTFVASSAFEQAYRTVLNVATSEARAAVQLLANQAAQSTNFQALTAGGQEIDMGAPPPRALALPWYKRIELWGALVGGLVGGAKLFERRSR